jgi:hypothetical protein
MAAMTSRENQEYINNDGYLYPSLFEYRKGIFYLFMTEANRILLYL